MKTKRRYFVAALLALVLFAASVPSASAAKPQNKSIGLLGITNSGEDIVFYTAVCIEEEDGLFVYSGNHPIAQQVGNYFSVTDSMAVNAQYSLEEDTDYDAVSGVYRFALGEKVRKGSEAEVTPKMASVGKNDTVYFAHFDDNFDFVSEKTTVASIKKGVMTTKDGLESDSGNGDFSVIFNDSGDVVGFCKSGVATTVLTSESSGTLLWGGIGCVVVFALLGGGFLVWKGKKKKEESVVQAQPVSQWDGGETVLNDVPEGVFPPESSTPAQYVLVCHGGYLNGRIYPVPPEGITIGREPDNSIRYPAQTPGISRHHVRIFLQNGQLVLVDLNSSNGTYLNKTGRIAPMRSVPLNCGDVFYLGQQLNGFEVTQK